MSKPVRIPFGEKLSIDDIQLKRIVPKDYEVIGSLQDSYDVVKSHASETIGALVVAGGVYFVFYIISYLISLVGILGTMGVGSLLTEANETLGTIVMVIGMVIIYAIAFTLMMVSQTLAMGYYLMCTMRVVRGQNVDLGKDYKLLKPFIKPLIVTSFVFTLAFMLGMLALIVGSYVVMLGCFFAQFLTIDKNISGIAALKASWRITEGHKLNLLGFFLVANLLNMVGMMACGLGLFITIPMTMVAVVTIYDSLVEPGNAYLYNATESQVFS